MKTLGTIQKLSRLGKTLSKIAFILTLVAAIMSLAAIVSLRFFPESVQLGGVTFRPLIEKTDGQTIAELAAGLILCVGEAVVAWLAQRYFQNELAAGTPFTFAGAKELRRLGICTICIPPGTLVLAEILKQVLAASSIGGAQSGGSASIGLGVMMIVASLLCKYGAELSDN